MYYTIYNSPFGDIAITANDKGLTALSFLEGEQQLLSINKLENKPEYFKETIIQLNQYFNHERQRFTLPLDPKGTAFQQQVWRALCTIPFGDTKSYAWLAKNIDNEKAVRAVGSANGKNPIALIIPCHRVIGSNKKLTGYAGGLALKAKLLTHESADFIDVE
ncbi:methylated-DNA--[protein]-cysteine S-methyltransferase [Thalassotalea piscium]|uniref:Methylated-DNA--protein-cysteine methyltransferase n=1 Tax=Thalassotalea piscium TaxID=1230533 RepID=A0A7X0TVA2_9GAMM|nr:methylated-DNA--[protein]-cysteine S-methyltransferase [Thalassotalea piscium]MBB6544920.1 methylated-DNA-[protein]-cysteine S-methyltransferase [Thalassotalea piscium]